MMGSCGFAWAIAWGEQTLVDPRRHVHLARARPDRRPARPARDTPVYRSAARRTITDVYDSDHVASGAGGKFRWLLSTILAAAVGAGAIAFVIVGSLDTSERPFSMPGTGSDLPRPAAREGDSKQSDIKWSVPKVDRLQTATGAANMRHLIQEQFQVKRDNRTFIDNRHYIRVTARLVPVPAQSMEQIPPFNPLRLNASTDTTIEGGPDGPTADETTQVKLQVVELLGGLLPAEDGDPINAEAAQRIVAAALDIDSEAPAIRPSLLPEGSDILTPRAVGGERPSGQRRAEPPPANTTVLPKTTADREDVADLERSEIRVLKVGRGDRLLPILQRLGADIYLAKALAEPAKSAFPEGQQLPVGSEIHVTMVPALQGDKLEPGAYSIYTESHVHRVSVSRNTAGEFVATASPINARLARSATLTDEDRTQASSLYAALYNAVLQQGASAETVLRIMRLLASETDFRRRVRSGDAIDLFFEAKDEPGAEPAVGELLFTALITGGEVQRYWRYRTPDGGIDYYNEFGNNSRKFLERRPVRGDAVRFASGFGIRLHPLLNERRMHNGIDWSAPTGTPIVAAATGTVEFADRRGELGNHVRIRHANGYQTTYSHLSRFGNGIREGIKVRQGQVIGFIGNSGLSAGPHLHFEVMVNNRFVDPMQIQVPRERRLTGKQAADFQRERQRIEELMRRPPVMMVAK